MVRPSGWRNNLRALVSGLHVSTVQGQGLQTIPFFSVMFPCSMNFTGSRRKAVFLIDANLVRRIRLLCLYCV